MVQWCQHLHNVVETGGKGSSSRREYQTVELVSSEVLQLHGAGFTLSESPGRVNHAFSRDFLADDSLLRGGQLVK